MDQIVTIAIASYNNAPYIERCVDSVINQTYSELEILVVDDGSQDDTLRRLENYNRETRLKIIKKENGGLSSVRQRALDEAKGNYICFIDADDYLAPTYVERMLGKLFADCSDICVCGTRFENKEGIVLEDWTSVFSCEESSAPFQTTPEVFLIPDNPQIKQLHLSDSWNKMYRVGFLRDSGVTFCMPQGMNGTDTLFNRLISLHSPKYSSVNDELYIHVIYKSSAVHRKNKNLLRTYQIITEKAIEESKSLGIYEYALNNIIVNYHNNLLEVFIDEYKECSHYQECSRRFIDLKKDNSLFVHKVENRLLKYEKGESLTMLLFLFHLKYATRVLPAIFKSLDLIKA